MNVPGRGHVERTMPLPSIAVAVGLLGLLGLLAPVAAADVKDAAAPCVNRGGALVRPIHDVTLDARTLAFCTGDDCWTLDRATNAVAAAPKVSPAPAPPRDRSGTLSDGKGTILATADKHHVEFCPGGVAAKACKRFKIAIKTPAVGVEPAMNAAGTLGAVLYRGGEEPDDPNRGPAYVLAYDLGKRKLLGKLEGGDVVVLDHGFMIDSAKLYSAAFKPVGALAAHDEVWIKVGASTDLVALRDQATGEAVLQDTQSAQVKARIPLGAKDKTTFFQLVSSADGAMVYAIGSTEDEGDIVVIDVATGKLVTHASPKVCAAGTSRRS